MTLDEAIEIIKIYRKQLMDFPGNLFDKDIEAFNIALSCMEKKKEKSDG